LIPRADPVVGQPVDVVPAGSIRSAGLVVVDVPPLNHVPDNKTDETPEAFATDDVHRDARVIFPEPSTELPVTAPNALELERNWSSLPVPAGDPPPGEPQAIDPSSCFIGV